MRTECLSFDRVPHTSRLFLNYLQDFPKVASYYGAPPLEREWLPRQHLTIAREYSIERRQAVAYILKQQNARWNTSPRLSQNLERLGNGASAVVSGQQVALFGGPLFSVLKA